MAFVALWHTGEAARMGTARGLSRRVRWIMVFAALALGMPTASQAATQTAPTGTTSMAFDSDPGDFVGGGVRQLWGPGDGTFTISGDRRSVHVFFTGGGFWSLDFAAAENRELVPGPYPGATRYPFQSPTGNGLSVSGDGRGCNTLTGRFVILEYILSPSGTVDRFAAAFEQHCEGAVPALRGIIRYNASATFAPPPDRDGDRVLDSLDNCLTAPNRNQADADRDGIGDVCDPIASLTSLIFVSDPGDYIGGGVSRTWYPSDGNFRAEGSANHISIRFDGGMDWWSLNFAAPEGQTLQPGTYEQATRYPFHEPSSPGLDVSGSGRGCNSLMGRFVILEYVLSPSGIVERFAADFEQHCEGAVPALRGTVLYSA